MWEKLARVLHVNPAFLVGWSNNPDVDQEQPSNYYKFAKPTDDLEQRPVKITLDDGHVIHDSMRFGDIDIGAYEPCELYPFKKSAIMAGHIVSIETDEGDLNGTD